MRDEGLYLEDIVEAADCIKEFLAGVTRDEFLKSNLLRSAVLQKLMVIGEAAARVSPELRSRHPEIEGTKVVAFRNIAAHAYFSVDWNLTWSAATLDALLLRDQVANISSTDYPYDEGEE